MARFDSAPIGEWGDSVIGIEAHCPAVSRLPLYRKLSLRSTDCANRIDATKQRRSGNGATTTWR